MKFDVCVVIVTYNRLEKLKRALFYYDNQQLLPSCIVVVNNASTDLTLNFLNQWKAEKKSYKKYVLTLQENIGGSGGYYEGEKFALTLTNIDWIMIADDDAYPMPDYLLGLRNSLTSFNCNEISVICGRVEENHNYVNIHRSIWNSKWNWRFHKAVPFDYYKIPFFEPDFVSYVGILIKKQSLEEVGLVNKDYFIWNDDTEHSYRLKKCGRIICFPKYCIIHDVANENNSLSWKSYYSFRNKTDFFKTHLPLQAPFVIAVSLIKAILNPFLGKSLIDSKIRIFAIINGVLGRLGKHKIYKPGWSSKK